MRLITIDDVRDLYIKIAQRGFSYAIEKATFNKEKRTKSAFNTTDTETSNWWMIPRVIERWNKLITGDEHTSYEQYISDNVLRGYDSLDLVSIGSGACSHELALAELNPHWDILCIDISDNLLEKAKDTARSKELTNIRFLNKNIYDCDLPNDHFDVVLFHASLHHFDHLEAFIPNEVKGKLKPKGKLVINEYVGPRRLQYSTLQIREINKCIKVIDKEYRSILRTNLYKNHYYGSGILRMIIADPSECIDSHHILPVIHKNFTTLEEKPFGGSLLMSALKDISHHFIELDERKEKVLNDLFHLEDEYLNANSSDFIFGIYEKQ